MSAIAATRSVRLAPTRSGKAARRATAAVATPRAVASEVDAETETSAAPAAASNVVFYRGQEYTEAQYAEAKASGAIDDLSKVEVVTYAEPPSFGGEIRFRFFLLFFILLFCFSSVDVKGKAAPSCSLSPLFFSSFCSLLLFSSDPFSFLLVQ